MRGVFSLILVQPANVRVGVGLWELICSPFHFHYVFVHPLVCVVRWFGEKTKKRKERKEKKKRGREKEKGRGEEKRKREHLFFFCFE